MPKKFCRKKQHGRETLQRIREDDILWQTKSKRRVTLGLKVSDQGFPALMQMISNNDGYVWREGREASMKTSIESTGRDVIADFSPAVGMMWRRRLYRSALGVKKMCSLSKVVFHILLLASGFGRQLSRLLRVPASDTDGRSELNSLTAFRIEMVQL